MAVGIQQWEYHQQEEGDGPHQYVLDIPPAGEERVSYQGESHALNEEWALRIFCKTRRPVGTGVESGEACLVQ
jgi:hypothetical protein